MAVSRPRGALPRSSCHLSSPHPWSLFSCFEVLPLPRPSCARPRTLDAFQGGSFICFYHWVPTDALPTHCKHLSSGGLAARSCPLNAARALLRVSVFPAPRRCAVPSHPRRFKFHLILSWFPLWCNFRVSFRSAWKPEFGPKWSCHMPRKARRNRNGVECLRKVQREVGARFSSRSLCDLEMTCQRALERVPICTHQATRRALQERQLND